MSSVAARALKVMAGGLGFLLLLTVLWLLGRILVYQQRDDPERVERKQEYLAFVAEVSRGFPRGPNFVVVLFDDLGYGDLGAYGSQVIRTPHLDRLARQGVQLTQAYAASPYCSASRAALLTGRYAVRSGLDHVVQPPYSARDLLLRLGERNRRLPAEEITLPEVLAAAGYATGMVGKWHLGDESPSLPNERGFDSFYGMLFSNDQGQPVVWRDREIVERHPIDQSALTRRYTEEAVAFLEAHRDRPFFLYLPHTFPHIPLHVAAERRGASAGGLYGDVVEELDESVGAVVRTLERLGLAEQTLVLVTSDNGPWFQGSPGGARGRKMDVFEGGMRVPFIASWPGRIPAAQVLDDLVMGIDVLPTVLGLAGLPLPDDRVIDGRNLMPLLEHGGPPPHEALYFYQLGVLRAVRQGRFKYHDRHRVFYGNPMNWPWGPMKMRGPWLFDLEVDPDESYDASDHHPEVAQRKAAEARSPDCQTI